MRAYRQAGEPARGLAEYARLRADLAAELGAEPAAETRAVHAALLAEPTTGRAGAATGSDGMAPGPAAAGMPSGRETGRVTGALVGRAAETGRRTGALVGRAAETGRLTERWAAAAAGRSGLVLLTGVAGIGKTWLAEDLAVLAAGTGGRVLRARCYRTERSLFLQPLADAVRPVLTGLPPAVLAELAGDDPAALAAVVSDVDGVLDAGPVGRWAGPAAPSWSGGGRSPGWPGSCAGWPPGSRCCCCSTTCTRRGWPPPTSCTTSPGTPRTRRCSCVATVRSGDADPVLDRLAEVAELLPVEPLTPAAVGRLAADAGRPELADRLYRLTRGHTLSAVETLRAVLAGDSGVPGSLRDAVLARVGRLGPQVEEVLRAASVLGPPFEPATLAGVLGVPAPDAARRCERALRAGLLAVTGSAYEFSNDLVQEVLSAATPEPTRVQYHRQAADLLADRPEAAAAHAAAAGQPVRAARAWLLAGEQALRRWAAADAERLVDRALAVLSTVDDPGAVELRGRAHLVRGRAREALAAYAPAWADHGEALVLARSAGDPRLEMAVLRELAGDVTVGLGRPTAECVPHLEAGVRIARVAGGPGQRGRPAGPARGGGQQPAPVRRRGPARPRRGGRRPGRARRRRAGRRAGRAEDGVRVLGRRGRAGTGAGRAGAAAAPAGRPVAAAVDAAGVGVPGGRRRGLGDRAGPPRRRPGGQPAQPLRLVRRLVRGAPRLGAAAVRPARRGAGGRDGGGGGGGRAGQPPVVLGGRARLPRGVAAGGRRPAGRGARADRRGPARRAQPGRGAPGARAGAAGRGDRRPGPARAGRRRCWPR